VAQLRLGAFSAGVHEAQAKGRLRRCDHSYFVPHWFSPSKILLVLAAAVSAQSLAPGETLTGPPTIRHRVCLDDSLQTHDELELYGVPACGDVVCKVQDHPHGMNGLSPHSTSM
jgi:hypothetical protein